MRDEIANRAVQMADCGTLRKAYRFDGSVIGLGRSCNFILDFKEDCCGNLYFRLDSCGQPLQPCWHLYPNL